MSAIDPEITELRRAQEGLRASEARFRMFVEHATDAFFLLDDGLLVVDVNRRACESLGYTREELIGKHPADFDADFDRDAIAPMAGRVRAGEVLTVESRHRRKDGTIFPVEIRVGFFEQGTRRFLSLVRDITDRKRAEEERRRHIWFLESLDRVNRTIQGRDDLQQMMDDVLDVVLDIFDCDLASLGQYEGELVHVVKVAARRERSGFVKAFPAGTDFRGSEDYDALKDALRAAKAPLQFVRGSVDPCFERLLAFFEVGSALCMELATRVPGRQDFYQLTLAQRSHARVWTDAETRLLEEIGRRLADGVGKMATLVHLQNSESRFRTYVDHATDALYVLGHDGVLVDVNRQACESLGYTREELLQLQPAAFEPQLSALGVASMVEPFKAGQTITFESAHRRKDGSTFPVEVRIRPFWQEEICLALALARDITDRKRAEEERERIRALERERETAVAAERSRLAGEIHDMLAQGLAMTLMQLADAEAKLGPHWSRAERPLNAVREFAVEGLTYARRTVNMLRPRSEGGGLIKAVRDLVEGVNRHSSVPATISIEGDPSLLPATVESALVSIAREALTNAARHARAADLGVQVAFNGDGAVLLTVADNGVGFDLSSVSPDSYGFVSMQQRAARAGVALTFVTEPGAGTQVVARWSPADDRPE